MTVDAAELAELRESPFVEEIIPNARNYVTAGAWAESIGVPATLAAGGTGAGRTIAVLDTGVQADHPYLAGKVVAEACWSLAGSPRSGMAGLCSGEDPTHSTGPGSASPCTAPAHACGHGTHVTGIAVGGPSSPSAERVGVASGASVIAVQVFTQGLTSAVCLSTPPCLFAYDSDLNEAMQWLYEQKDAGIDGFAELDAVNLSLGTDKLHSGYCDAAKSATKTQVDRLRSVGVATVVASGNQGATGMMAEPACISGVVSVGATSTSGALASFSNASTLTTLLAPGQSIDSSWPVAGFTLMSGTSMATPMVSGAVALLRQADPLVALDDVVDRLRTTGSLVATSFSSTGLPRIQLDAALLGVPSPPRAVTATGGFGVASVSWLPPSFAGSEPVTDVVVTASPGGATCTSSGTSCTVTGLSNGVAYTFTAVANSSNGTSAPSTRSSVVIPSGLPSGSPFGSLDVVSGGPGSVRVAGWALDPDTAASIDVHVYVDGRGYPLRADRSRSDVGAAFPGYGSAHGFSVSVPASGGSHQVCAYAINVGSGGNSLLGCRTVVVPSGSPFGSLDVVSAGPGSVRVAGWALDPDTAASIPVHVYVGGRGTALTADRTRSDVGAAYPGYGSAHGFSRTLSASPGAQRVCAYAINVGRGSTTLLGCRTVVVPSGSPFGSLDVVTRSGSEVRVAGWALDPDTAAPIDVHVYVGGSGFALTADRSRPDVGAAFPGYGSAHGFSRTLAIDGRGLPVCVYAINTGRGANSLIGCR
nr:S8 family serine peptidase [Rhabdothermincola salaria]